MTTIYFNIQRFALPDAATLSANGSSVSISGSDTETGIAPIETATSETAAAIIANNYTPATGDTQTLDGVTYTYDGTNWNYETTTTETSTTTVTDTTTISSLLDAAYAAASPVTLDGTTYTYADGQWTYPTTTTVETTTTVNNDALESRILDAAYTQASPVPYDGTDYTYAEGVWTYNTEETVATTTAVTNTTTISSLRDAAYTKASPVPYEGTDYTYADGQWTYQTTTTNTDSHVVETGSAEESAVLAEVFTTASSVTVDGAFYTYEDGTWYGTATDSETGETSTVAIDTTTATYDDITAAAIDKLASQTIGPATVDIGDTTYTYNGTNWDAETTSTVETTETVTDATAIEAAVLESTTTVNLGTDTYTYEDGTWSYETTTTVDTTATVTDFYTVNQLEAAALDKNSTVNLDDTTYTYADGSWSYPDTTTVDTTATVEDATAVEAAALDNTSTVSLNDTTYSYENGAWSSSETVSSPITATADSSTAANIISNFYTPASGDSATLDGTAYSFDGSNWTFEGSAPTVTTYYRFSTDSSSASAPADILTDSTTAEATLTATSSPAYLNHGDFSNNLILDGIGSITAFDTGTIQLTAAEDTLALTGIYGFGSVGSAEDLDGFAFASANRSVDWTVNDAHLDFNIARGTVVSLAGISNDDTDFVVVAADSATLNSIDDAQSWYVDDNSAIVYSGVNFYGNDGGVILEKSSNGDWLTAYLDDGDALFMEKTGSASGRVDSVEVNNAIIGGAANAGAQIGLADEAVVTIQANNIAQITVDSNVSADLAAGSTATILTGDESNSATLSAIDKLNTSGKWVTDESEVTLGDEKITVSDSTTVVTITADKAGTSIARLDFASATVTVSSASEATEFTADGISIGSAATWNATTAGDGSENYIAFDDSGNATVNSNEEGATVSLSSGKSVALTAGLTGDVIEISKGDIVTITEESVTANSIAAGGDWTVASEYAILGNETLQTEDDADGIRAIISSSKGNSISAIDSLAGDATLSYTDDPSGLTVASKTWTIKNDSDKVVNFDKDGNVTVSASADTDAEVLSVTGVADAGVHVDLGAMIGGINVNKVTVNYLGGVEGLDFVLENVAHNAGIKSISGIEDEAIIGVSGDSAYTINGFNYANTARNEADFIFEDDAVTLVGVQNGDAVTLTGGDAEATFGEGTVASAKVSINGVGVTVDASAADDLKNVAINFNGSDIQTISGVKVGTEIDTKGDSAVTVVYDSSAVEDEGTYNLTVNDTDIRIDGDNFTGDKATLAIGTDGEIDLTGVSLGAGDTLTVTGGTYKIGKSAAVSVTETIGYITFDSFGNATAIEKSVADNRAARDANIIDAIDAASDASIAAFDLFYNLGKEDNGAPSSSIAGYDDAADTTPSSSSVDGGINIYGNAALNSSDLKYVTLQSAAEDDIIVTGTESQNIRTEVIDVRGGENAMVVIDPISNSGVNHTVYGSNKANGYIVFGSTARGNNYAQAGSLGSYLSNSGGDATLLGGAGNDTILAGDGDYVIGGAGADYFYDENGSYEIRDYNVTQGDVIVATNLADINKNLDARTLVSKISASDNVISIADGNELTLTSAASVAGNNAIFTDATAKDLHRVTWASVEGGTVSAAAFGTDVGVLMISDNNNAADLVIGSSGNDTIFVGGNDTVNAGAGRDEIYMTAADVSKREEGAVVSVAGGGRTYIHGFQFGFDNSAGDNVINIGTSATVDTKGDTLIAYGARDTVYFVDNDATVTANSYEVLSGTPDEAEKWLILKQGANVVVDDADKLADKYYAAADINATLTFGVDPADTINLSGSAYQHIHNVVLANDGEATLVGTGDKDVIQIGGTEAKHISLGAGNDSIVSNGNNSLAAGNTFYFGLNSDGTDVIDNFGFDKDTLILYNWDEAKGSGITANANNLEVKVNDDSILNLSGAVSTDNQIRYKLGYDGEVEVAKFGITNGTRNSFTHDTETTVYYGNVTNDSPQDTLVVSAADDNVAVWLDNEHGARYYGIGVLDGSAATGTQLTLVGGTSNNTIYGGGEGTSSSLWGGNSGDNELFGGDGNDMFFFAKGASNDTINGYTVGSDRIRLLDVTLDDLLDGSTFFDGDNIKIALKAEAGGGTLTIADAANGTQVEVSNGNGGYTSYTANTTAKSWS